MNARRKIAASAMIAALCGFAAPAFAADVVVIETTPTTTYYYEPPVADYYYDAVTGTYHYYPTTASAPPITVTAPVLTEDEIITHDVMGALAAEPRLSGRIGVETLRNEVTLSGRVGTPLQVDIAADSAMDVAGVREVHNLLRPQVGPVR